LTDCGKTAQRQKRIEKFKLAEISRFLRNRDIQLGGIGLVYTYTLDILLFRDAVPFKKEPGRRVFSTEWSCDWCTRGLLNKSAELQLIGPLLAAIDTLLSDHLDMSAQLA